MEKNYDLPEENNEESTAREPAPEYGTEIDEELDEDNYPQPPLTQEEIDNALTGDQVIKLWQDYLEKKLGK